MKLRFRKPKLFITASFLLCASTTLHAFTPPDGYQGRLLVPRTLMIQPGIASAEIHPSFINSTTQPEFESNITQQEGLRICFYELEVDVRNCQYAFQNNISGFNECVIMAGESHTSCLTWVQKLPVEENSN